MHSTRSLRSVDEVREWFDKSVAEKRGYAEVEVVGRDYPVLTVSARDHFVVIHWFPSPDEVFVLVGDGVVPEQESLDLPVHNDLATFTGRFISDLDRGRQVVLEALRTSAVEALGEWERL